MTEPIVAAVSSISETTLLIPDVPVAIRVWRKAAYDIARGNGLKICILIHRVELPGAKTALYAYTWHPALTRPATVTRDEAVAFHHILVEVDHLRPPEMTVSPKLAEMLKAEQKALSDFELPGMWETADFESGDPDERPYD